MDSQDPVDGFVAWILIRLLVIGAVIGMAAFGIGKALAFF